MDSWASCLETPGLPKSSILWEKVLMEAISSPHTGNQPLAVEEMQRPSWTPGLLRIRRIYLVPSRFCPLPVINIASVKGEVCDYLYWGVLWW